MQSLRVLHDALQIPKYLRVQNPVVIQWSRFASSSTRWKTRQTKDLFTREAKVQGLKSRAAFKLLEMNQKYKVFKKGQSVVDLGYAPGSWSQVAIDRVSPGGRVIGIDIIPAQPPKGVSTIQGNFLSPAIQAEVRAYVQDYNRGRVRSLTPASEDQAQDQPEGYIDLERHTLLETDSEQEALESKELETQGEKKKRNTVKLRDEVAGRVVDVVLSDMCAPWPQTSGFYQKSISDPYHRMMNTSGNSFKDHADSMDLCMAALNFCYTTLRTGGHFLCKFYNGAEDKELEKRLKLLFEKVHREKPDASRKDSKEAYFVALRRKEDAPEDKVLQPLG